MIKIDYVLFFLTVLVFISAILIVVYFLSQKKQSRQQIINQNHLNKLKQQQQLQQQYQQMMQQLKQQQSQQNLQQQPQKTQFQNPNHPLLKKVEEARKQFQSAKNGSNNKKIGDFLNPDYKKDYKEIYKKIHKEQQEKKKQNKEKDQQMKNTLSPEPKSFLQTVDSADDVNLLYGINKDGTKAKKNQINEKLDQQLYWKKNSKIVFAGMIVSALGLLIMMVE